jgi:two-component system sensor histidine kinase KdpD
VKGQALNAVKGQALDESELAVATWAYRQGQPAGHGTDTLPAAAIRFLPLKTQRGVVGVLGVRPANPSSYLSPEQRRLLEAIASQAALAIERVQLAEQAQQAQLLQAAEKLQGALLNSISHDLRTPLVSITGALTTLEADGEGLDAATRRNLVVVAREEADRLNRLVGNLLDMSRIEAGALRVHREPGDVQEVIGAALERLDAALRDRPVTVDVPASLPAVPMDFVLIVQVLVNLVDNALKYSPAGSPIEIRCRAERNQVQITVADRGSGIPPEDLERIFDKFFRVQRPEATAGTGLGLAICKGIVEAHGGRIWAENRPDGGAVLTLVLPPWTGRQDRLADDELGH